MIAAIASGDVPIGNIGSTPLIVAASKDLPVEVFYISSLLGESEALIAKDYINNPKYLIGKKIAVTFVSTAHYSLLSEL